MSVSFSHKSDPLVARDFGYFVDMVHSAEVNTSSNTVRQMEIDLRWKFERDPIGGHYIGEIPVAQLQKLIDSCETFLDKMIAIVDSRDLSMQRIVQLRVLAKQALQYNEPITYG